LRTLVIDGDHLVFRHLFVKNKRTLKSSSLGIPTGIVFGVLSSLDTFLEQFKRVDRCVFCLGGGRSRFRSNLSEEYKKKRTNEEFSTVQSGEEFSSSEMLKLQIPILEHILSNMGVRVGRLEGFEADDLVALCVLNLVDSPGEEVILVSGDLDYLQAIAWGNNISVYRPIPNKEEYVDRENFYSLYGVVPQHYIWFKAIVGDPSDNISGVVRGLGEVRAKKLFEHFPPNVELETLKQYAASSADKIIRRLAEEENWKKFVGNLMLMDWKRVPFSYLERDYVDQLFKQPVTINWDLVESVMRSLELKRVSKLIGDEKFSFLG
jgi:DNA polymerase-1